MTKHTILFLAANPVGTNRRALDKEARAIPVELECSGFRDSFELVTRWAAELLDLLREQRKLKPTVVHFSGPGVRGDHRSGAGPGRAIVGGAVVSDGSAIDGDHQHGLFFQGSDGRPKVVSTTAQPCPLRSSNDDRRYNNSSQACKCEHRLSHCDSDR